MSNKNQKRSFTEIETFIARWKQSPVPHLRMGQHFCNTFDITDNQLFYAVNMKQIENMIWSTWWNKSEAEAEH